MGGERMAERMARGRLGEAGRTHRLLHGPLQDLLVQVMAPLLSGIGINGAMTGRKDILPAPLAASIRVFSGQRIGQRDLAKTGIQIVIVNRLDLLQVTLQGFNDCGGQQSDPILETLPIVDGYLPHGEIHILDPQAQALHQPETSPIQ